ncbi:Fantom protein [Quillaja saponaria]|uniref:Fantom protein n=1 Tax=Quillaja saponaria TaxID=32244 RepID=A0AAD7PLS3_QUISA|nr:Fantom protein [Quillaja saponaria]
MLCSAPAGKKSGSKWLDRLRSNKGIPTGDNLDLDYFLTDHPNTFSDSDLVRSNSESTHLDQRHFPNGNEPSEISNNNGDKQWVGIMSNVLCELFNMGGYPTQSSKLSRKKCSRKQTNPKFCVISSPSNNVLEKSADFCRKDENIPAKSSFDNDMMDMKEENMEDGNIEEDKGDKEELSGYSRSEVTVIDTSSPGWKFEKLVFRRKNVWKVREKKGRSNFFGRKKRKWSNEVC